jgi:hypothetical protein
MTLTQTFFAGVGLFALMTAQPWRHWRAVCAWLIVGLIMFNALTGIWK